MGWAQKFCILFNYNQRKRNLKFISQNQWYGPECNC